MAEIWIPLIAGFFATAAVSLMMLAKQVMRIMATMDIIGGISGMGGHRAPRAGLCSCPRPSIPAAVAAEQSHGQALWRTAVSQS